MSGHAPRESPCAKWARTAGEPTVMEWALAGFPGGIWQTVTLGTPTEPNPFTVPAVRAAFSDEASLEDPEVMQPVKALVPAIRPNTNNFLRDFTLIPFERRVSFCARKL